MELQREVFINRQFDLAGEGGGLKDFYLCRLPPKNNPVLKKFPCPLSDWLNRSQNLFWFLVDKATRFLSFFFSNSLSKQNNTTLPYPFFF